MTDKKASKDLGLDLLKDEAIEWKYSSEEKDELFSSAQILWNEGWVSESKKVLRQILRWDPSAVSAQKLLDEILAAELSDYLGREKIKKDLGVLPENRNKFSMNQKINPLAVESKLLEDLFQDAVEQDFSEDEKLFQDSYAKELERSFLTIYLEANPQELIDYSVVFFEMGFVPLAMKALNKLVTFPEFEELGSLMKAEIYLKCGDCKNILSLLHTGIKLERPELEFNRIYLIARAFENLGRNFEALEMYKILLNQLALTPEKNAGMLDFRDTRLRVRILKKGGWIL